MAWWMVALAGGCGLSLYGEVPEAHDGFVREGTVRIVEPANGADVDPAFALSFETGGDVAEVALTVDGRLEQRVLASDPMIDVTADVGKHIVVLHGLAADGSILGEHAIAVHVVESGPWVAIVSPSDGSEVVNPVSFTLSASPDVESIELFADGWPLGTVPSSHGSIAYTFAGLGYAREIVAQGSANGAIVATDTIEITVTAAGPVPTSGDLGALVQALLAEYPTDGTNDYWWPADSDWAGTTRDVWYQGALVAEADPYGRCYCVGLTWEVYMRAFQAADLASGGDGTLNGMTISDLEEFQTDWYVRELLGAGASDALESYGIGWRVASLSDVKPGDFVQLWRNNGTGHSVIFQDWERDGTGAIVGLDYWSTQSSTEGIDFNDEYFGAGSWDVDPNLVFVGRAAAPSEWIPWD
jgi:hypothetical protein